jgi:predicted DNA-binding transcriptional regulator YafY
LERKRLVADRFKRIWSIVECIADEPGLDRAALAQRFALSQRQLQSDLNVIRADIGLPLRRERGYRFISPANDGAALTLADLLTLCQMVRAAGQDPDISRDGLAILTAKLANAFPPPLRPLVRDALAAAGTEASDPLPELLVYLASAMAQRQPVRLRFAAPIGSGFPTEPIMEPEVLLPYGSSWYLIGHCRQRNRILMLCLDELAAVEHCA